MEKRAAGDADEGVAATTTAFYFGAVTGIVLTVLSIRLVRVLLGGKRLI